MLCWWRHPLTLLTGGSNESTAICTWVCALRIEDARPGTTFGTRPVSAGQNGLDEEDTLKAAAWSAAEEFTQAIANGRVSLALAVRTLVIHYREEKMPKRIDTRRSYEVWLSNHILPKWGDCSLSDVQARPVEIWLQTLALAPKSKAHIRGLLSMLWDYAMWRGDVPTQRNPMELVTVKGSTKRKRQPRSLTAEELRSFVDKLEEPFRTIALLCVCLGLRISECLALKWSDVDCPNSKLGVERGIVCQQVDEVKTPESQQKLVIDGELLTALQMWKQSTQFPAAEDWIFASPVQLGRLPWSYDQVWRVYQKAGKEAGLGGLGTHSLRHTYRTWLDSVGTAVGCSTAADAPCGTCEPR